MLSFWLPVCAVLLYAIEIVCVAFQFGIWGRMCNLIASVPDHCCFIYYALPDALLSPAEGTENSVATFTSLETFPYHTLLLGVD